MFLSHTIISAALGAACKCVDSEHIISAFQTSPQTLGVCSEDQADEAAKVVQELQYLHKKRGVPWGEMAILYRMTAW